MNINNMFNFGIDEEEQKPFDYAGIAKFLRRLFGMEEEPKKNNYSVSSVEENPAHQDYFRNILENYYKQQTPQADPYKSFGIPGSYYNALRQRESGGKYDIVNKLGYLGAYQFGAPALEDLGYLKKGASKGGNAAENNPANWTIPGGKDAFLANKQLQDEAMRRYTELNKQRLQKLGVINQGTPQPEVSGLLAVAHLLGPGGAKAYLKGQNRKDAFGTSASDYFNIGKNTLL